MSSQPSIVNIDMKKKSDGDRARKIVFRNEKKKRKQKKRKTDCDPFVMVQKSWKNLIKA